jgi:hypothetical protein
MTLIVYYSFSIKRLFPFIVIGLLSLFIFDMPKTIKGLISFAYCIFNHQKNYFVHFFDILTTRPICFKVSCIFYSKI